jgi:DNA modification methylase
MNEYQKFLKGKEKRIVESGFEVQDCDLNPRLFDFQKFCIKRALKKGKYALFESCGLGKTIQQLEWANQVYKHTNKPVLILAPLSVSLQTIDEGRKFGIEVIKYNGSNNPIQISNYEQLDNIDCSIFSGIVLDESSILKSFDGSTKKKIIESFKNTPYKLACTATPSPNDPMELGNHAEFLDVMSYNEMLAMYFVHDGGDTSKWRLKGHATESFYKFIGSWSVMFSTPSDIGFSQDGYNLPPLNYIEEQIVTPKKDNGKLFNDNAVNATNFNQELRDTMELRLNKVAEIVNSNPNEPFIIWIKQNQEGEMLRKLIPEAIEVKGSDSDEWKENKLLGFAKGEFRVLITKTKIASFGMNYQNCNNQIFASLDFSFEGLYQAIRRCYRFGQLKQVNVYLITTDTMANVKETINEKQKKFEIMQETMSKTINENLNEEYLNNADYDTKPFETEHCSIKKGDCVQLIKDIPNESIGLSIFSPPFAELYTYSNYVEDMGNSKDYKEFLTQFQFLVKELYRVIQSGRNVCVHCMDLPIQKGKEGFIGLRDFSGMILKLFEDCGFIYHSRITIWKDPVVEMQRTKALGLLHKQIKKDSTMCRVGIPDYVLVFRKDGERQNPVCNTNMSVDLWQKIASPVWMDINQSNTLQGIRDAREDKDEKHICPLQLEVIERCILLYSNEGDKILTPFMGIGSEVYQSVKMNRFGVGFELKDSYYEIAVKNIKTAINGKKQTSLFD